MLLSCWGNGADEVDMEAMVVTCCEDMGWQAMHTGEVEKEQVANLLGCFGAEAVARGVTKAVFAVGVDGGELDAEVERGLLKGGGGSRTGGGGGAQATVIEQVLVVEVVAAAAANV